MDDKCDTFVKTLVFSEIDGPASIYLCFLEILPNEDASFFLGDICTPKPMNIFLYQIAKISLCVQRKTPETPNFFQRWIA